ncbi:MAG: tRNA uridine-5-carboxymethylaminomethyl(34) synthesis GTPase MnmE [Candidatus Omnitrophota bacterium]
MPGYNINDTIAAIATGVGESGIGIVRISGKEALAIADRIFISRDKRPPSTYKTYTTHYGWIVRPFSSSKVLKLDKLNSRTHELTNSRTKIIDEVILTVMRAPKSYTKEDIVEINCHGGILPLREVLELILENGCRLSGPGEFTRRAFLNGRIDLAQAEAVLDIIRAKTDSALKMSAQQLHGALSALICRIRRALLDILSALEANIDFPDEDIIGVDPGKTAQKLRAINSELKGVIDGSRQGRVFREGINAVICGKPNAGKSSLLNALLKQERSIVTPLAGTTRDTIEEVIDIKGIPVRFVDTAGIIEPRDLVEKKAVQRSKRYIGLADLVILLFDGSRRLTGDDDVLIRTIKKKETLAVINKMDLKPKIEDDKIRKRFRRVINISAKKNKNIDLLEGAIVDLFCQGEVDPAEPVIVSNLRHIEAVKKAQKLIAEAVNSLDNKLSEEFVAQDLRDALGYLDDILGRRFSEDLLNKIFSQFCIGK